MSEVNALAVSKREGVGKGAARAARRNGLVPGVVYGAGKPPVSVNIKHNELLKALQRGKFLSSLLDLDVDGETVRVVPKDVQKDVVLDMPTHVDFLRLSDRSRITLFISIEFLNEDKAPGLKKGGVLVTQARDVPLKVRAGAIPEKVVCDLGPLAIGDTLTFADLPLPAGSALMAADPTAPVVSIAAPSGLAAGGDDEGEEGGDGESAEG